MNFKTNTLLNHAVQAYQQGNLKRAEEILYHCINLNIKTFDILHLLALVNAGQNKHLEAIKFYKKALNTNQYDASFLCNFGTSLSQVDLKIDALSMFQKAIEKDPTVAEYYYNYGNTLHDMGDFEEALNYYQKSIVLNPRLYQAHANCAKVLSNLGLHSESILSHDKAINLQPDNTSLWINKGLTLIQLKQFEEALYCYDRALYINSTLAEAWYEKANLLFELKYFDDAITHYEKAIQLKQNYVQAWCNKGNTYYQIKIYQEALNCFDNALIFDPNHKETWNNKGIVLSELKIYHEALNCFDKAIVLDKKFANAWSNKGLTLNDLHRYADAVSHLDRAIKINPNIDWLYGDLIHTKMKICDWTDFSRAVESIVAMIESNKKVITAFSLLSLIDSPFFQKRAAEIYFHSKTSLNQNLKSLKKKRDSKKIRIGYFSADFREHPVSYLLVEMFELHNKDRFETIAFSYGESDNSSLRARIFNAFDKFIDISGMSDKEILDLSLELRIDIAIDMGGHTRGARMEIFGMRVAPIQVNYFGYPGTTGSNRIDYIIADKTIIPDENFEFYAEKVVHLPNSYMVDDSKRTPSSRKFSRAECGLPENNFIFCCFNTHYKFNPQTLDRWSRILREIKSSILWVAENNNEFKNNLRIEFDKRGIQPSRIIYAPRMKSMADHLARLNLADLFLDTHPYNAHTTCIDSLKAGIPVLTLIGNSFAGRVSASVLKAIGLPELIAYNESQYENIAIDLATNPEKLLNIKFKLANNRSNTSLFDTPLYTRNIEQAYMKMIERYDLELTPEHIVISN